MTGSGADPFASPTSATSGAQRATDELIAAVGIVARQGSDVHLVLGGSPGGAYSVEALMAQVRRCGVEDRVTYLGPVSGRAKAELFANAHLFAFPTVFAAESFGLVLAEALCWGLPVVASDWRANCEVLAGTDHVLHDVAPDLAGEVARGPCRTRLPASRTDAGRRTRRPIAPCSWTGTGDGSGPVPRSVMPWSRCWPTCERADRSAAPMARTIGRVLRDHSSSRSVLAEVWRSRARRPPGSAAWMRLWARRARHLPRLVLLGELVRSLRSGGADIGERVALGAVEISGPLAQLSIGDGTAIDGATLRLRGAIRIGRCVAVNRGATLLAGNHDANSPSWDLVPHDIEVGDHAWIGTNAIVVGPCRIGTGAVVSAGAVVGVDVPDGAIAIGNPARDRRRPHH